MSDVSLQKVSGALRKAGLRAAKWNASGMVRGWGDWISGVRVFRNHAGMPRITTEHGRWHKGTEEVAAREVAAITAALDAAGLLYVVDGAYVTVTGAQA
jgi:hypothetical protein